MINDNNKDDDISKGHLPEGAIPLGDSWAGVRGSLRSGSKINKDRAQSLGSILENLRAIKGDYYVSVLLTTVNHFNLLLGCLSIAGCSDERVEKIGTMVDDVILNNFAILVGAHYKLPTPEAMGQIVQDMLKDFEMVTSANHAVLNNDYNNDKGE